MSEAPTTADGRRIDREILHLALPATATLATEPLYQLADTAVVARLGTEPLAGVAAAAALLLLGSTVFIFLTFGTAAAVARLLGAHRAREADEQTVAALWLAVVLGLAAAGITALGAPVLLDRFGAAADGPVREAAMTYLRIGVLGFPGVTVAMAGSGALRGRLDTRGPLLVAATSALANLALLLWFVPVLGWGVAGAAWSTVAAKWLGALLLTARVLRRIDRPATGFRPHWPLVLRLARVGGDLFLRTVALRVVLTLGVALAGRRGAASLAAYQIAFGWWAFTAYVYEGIEAAGQALVGRELGAEQAERARRVGHRLLGWSLAVAVLAGAATVMLRSPITALFTGDPEVVPLVLASLVWVGAMQPLCGPAFCLDGILVGAGDQRFMAVAMVAAGVAYTGIAVGLTAADTGLWGVWLAMTLLMALRVVLLGGRFRGDRWVRLGAAA